MIPSLSRKRWFPAVALFAAVTFIGTDFGLRMGIYAQIAWAQGASKGRLALFVVPRSRRDSTDALILKGLLRSTADRMAASGIERAFTSPVADPDSLAVVEQQVEAGFSAMNAGKWDQALKAYLEAELNLAKCRGIAPRKTVARVYKGLGLALANTGKPDSAETMIHRSLVVYPNQQASEYAYNLESRKLFTKVSRALRDAPNGSLNINASVNAAEIYVDYEFRGFSPVRVSGLPAGEHLVTVFADGKRLYSEFVTVKGGADDTVKPVLGAAVGGTEILNAAAAVEKALHRKRQALDASAALAAATGATDVVFLMVSGGKGGFDLEGIHWKDGKITPLKKTLARDATLVLSAQGLLADALGTQTPMEAEMGPLEAAPVALPAGGEGALSAAGEGDDLVIDPNSPIFKNTGAKEEDTGIVDKWWFWTAIGAVVAVGLGVGLGVGLSQGGGSGPANSGDISITLHGAQ
ncbi:MAG: PEGA domain-containing protein [Deltaproteobacteria bacterium]|nr:PEGA domain-containing protein [Deltaproteobacteria bacterium]